MIVYYTTSHNQFLHDPKSLIHSFFSNYDGIEQLDNLKKCPSFINNNKNSYIIDNVVDYELTWNGNSFSSSIRDHEYFNKFVNIRDYNMGLVSYENPGISFISEKPLEISTLPPFMHNVDIKNKALFLTGRYDIGKHYRPLECPILFCEKNSTIKFVTGSPQFYVKFHTNEKIKFVKFFNSAELIDLQLSVLSLRNGFSAKPLSFFYDIFTKNYRKKIFQLIKRNLAE